MRQEFLGTHPLLQPRTAMTDTGVVVTYVRWHRPDEDLYCYEELDGEQWPTRHIEVRRDKTFAAAASLAEVLKAGESGGAAAVSAYRRPGPPARAPVRLPSAQWLLVHGSRLRPLGTGCPSTAVVIEPAHRTDLAPLLMQAYELTPREREITEMLLRGVPIADMATALWLSPHTVRDHVKAVFSKLTVRSRPELTAMLFYGHHAPMHQAR